ncbi:MAG: HEAT repeat domain-containing protein [Saprospiraceae bacterium]|nr:HEAT repeat domain-containing protein [Lewinella sp.]
MHSSIIAGRDAHVGDNITNVTVAKPVFSEINLEAYEGGDEYVSPRFTGQLVSIIQAMKGGKMIVLTGFYGFDKAGFTKHLAAALAEDYEGMGKELVARECQITSNFYDISSAIRENEDDCIFVLNNLIPKDVNHDLSKLQKAAQASSHLIIILASTNLPLSAWKDPNADYWYRIDADGLYHGTTQIVPGIYQKPKLLRHLTKACDQRGLDDYKENLKIEFGKLIPTPINTPEQIALFLDLFAKSPKENEKKIAELVAKSSYNDKLLQKWFDSLPEDKELIALGMTLLNGMYADQFFVVMQTLGKDAWDSFRPVSALDYNNLTTLLHFFSFTSGDSPTLEAKFPNQRFQTLQSIWPNYQRRIISALPVLVKLAIKSVSGEITSWELFGDRDKRIRLREVLGEIFSDLGRLSPQAVEPWLLQLAAHGNVGVQLVAARALAQWREPYEDPESGKTVNKEEALFSFLNKWHKESRKSGSRIMRFRRSVLDEEDGSRNSMTAYVRATILLTLGYASVYDNTNSLNPEILELVIKFAKDRNQLVIRRLQDTLYLLIRNHPWQIGDKLFDLGGGGKVIFNPLLPLEEYAGAIAAGLADAYPESPADVEALLEDWYSYCNVNRPKYTNVEKLEYREKILATVVLSYRFLPLKETLKLSLDHVADQIEDLRNKEHHPAIRSVLLDAILDLYAKYFTDMEARHSKKIPKMDIEERKRAAQYFRWEYLNQRKELAGGDYEVKFEGIRMESWREQEERPLTDIENTLVKWIGSKNENIMRIALQSFIELSKVEAWEEQEVQNYLQEIEEKHKAKYKTELRTYDDSVRKGLWVSIRNLFGGGNKIKDELMAIAKEDEEMGELQVKILKEKFKRVGFTI